MRFLKHNICKKKITGKFDMVVICDLEWLFDGCSVDGIILRCGSAWSQELSI